MTITLDTAILIDTLASAASKIGSTDASAELLKRIEELAEVPSLSGEITRLRGLLVRFAELNYKGRHGDLTDIEAEELLAHETAWYGVTP